MSHGLVQFLVLTVAGLVAGALTATAGNGGLVSLMALLWTGAPVHVANVANQVAQPPGLLIPATVMLKHRDRSHVVPTIAMCAGTVAGSLILADAAAWFRLWAPWLILAAAGAVAVHPFVQGGRITVRLVPRVPAAPAALLAIAPPPEPPAAVPAGAGRVSGHPIAYVLAMAVCGLYAGVIGAGVGTIALAAISYTTGKTTSDSVPARNMACLTASLVAFAVLVTFGPVDWRLVLPLWPALFVGGALGVHWMKWFRKRDAVFRAVVVVAAMCAAGWLLWIQG